VTDECATEKPSSTIHVLEDSLFLGRLQATDNGDYQVTYQVDKKPAHGVLEIEPLSGEMAYMPFGNFSGHDSFSYTVTDSKGGKASTRITAHVAPRCGKDAFINAIWNPGWGVKHYLNALHNACQGLGILKYWK